MHRSRGGSKSKVRLRAILYEVARIQVPGKDNLGRSVWHALDFNTEATRQHNMNALMDALNRRRTGVFEAFSRKASPTRA